MLSRQRDRLAKAQTVGLHQARFGGTSFRLVGDQVHVLARPAQHLGKALIERGNAGARIDHEQDDVGLADGELGLLAHAVFEAAIGDILIAGGVEHPELQLGDMALRLAAVTRDAGGIIDQGDLPADEPVE